MKTKSLDEIAQALCKGDVISANCTQYDLEDVRAVMGIKGLDMYDAAYELAEEIKGEE